VLNTLSLLAATGLGCGGNDGTTGVLEPATGVLSVTTVSHGNEPDSDGYVLEVDGTAKGPIADRAPVVLAQVPVGSHSVTLGGLAPFCSVDGGASRTVDIVAGDITEVTLDVACQGASRLGIVVSTTGGTPDVDGYVVSVDGQTSVPVTPNGTSTIASLVGGAHVVTLSGLSFNCLMQGPNPWTVAVGPGDSVEVRISVGCSTLAPWRPVYSAWREGDVPYGVSQSEVFAVDLEAGTVINLSQSRSFDDFDGELSPDHTQVAFTQGVNVDEDERAVAVVNVDGTGLRTLVLEPSASQPQWSPDGLRIAFQQWNTDDYDLFMINADGTGKVDLGRFRPPYAWSPDGTSIIAYRYSERGQSADIWMVPADGGNAVDLTTTNAYSSPTWSPDGQRLAFARGTDIWLMNADGSGQRALTATLPGNKLNPHWSPDGSVIMFEVQVGSGIELNGEIYTIRPDGTHALNLTSTPDINEDGPAWSSDGTRIVFTTPVDGQALGQDNVFLMNADGSGRRNISDHP
jgi:Tol biopolymer transport system component